MQYNQLDKLASAIHNNVLSGLAGFHTNFSISMEQLKDAIVDERLLLIKEYMTKGVLTPDDLYISINCIPVDCKDIERCQCNSNECLTELPHFEIPQLINDLGDSKISYLGSNDRMNPFIFYTSLTPINYRQYKKRKKNKPYVWIDTTPNENGMYDCFIFNAPLLNQVSITAAFKDIRQLEQMASCNCNISDEHRNSLDAEIIDRVTKKFVTYYRQMHMPPIPNTQQYTPG